MFAPPPFLRERRETQEKHRKIIFDPICLYCRFASWSGWLGKLSRTCPFWLGSPFQSSSVHSLGWEMTRWHCSQITDYLWFHHNDLWWGWRCGEASSHVWKPASGHFSQSWASADCSCMCYVWCESVSVAKWSIITWNLGQVDSSTLRGVHGDIINTQQSESRVASKYTGCSQEKVVKNGEEPKLDWEGGGIRLPSAWRNHS